jgi:hypothetical protein
MVALIKSNTLSYFPKRIGLLQLAATVWLSLTTVKGAFLAADVKRSVQSTIKTDTLAAEAFQPRISKQATKLNAVVVRTEQQSPLTHADLIWRLCPPENFSLLEKTRWRLEAKLARIATSTDQQRIWFPPYARQITIGRFGITVQSGPPVAELVETIHDLFHNDDCQTANNATTTTTAAAIIYMVVDESYRSRHVGSLALQVMDAIHCAQGCAFTVLVADDNGSGKLVTWYQQQGFKLAPKLQTVFGSPNQQFGITMIRPTSECVNSNTRLEWW